MPGFDVPCSNHSGKVDKGGGIQRDQPQRPCTQHDPPVVMPCHNLPQRQRQPCRHQRHPDQRMQAQIGQAIDPDVKIQPQQCRTAQHHILPQPQQHQGPDGAVFAQKRPRRQGKGPCQQRRRQQRISTAMGIFGRAHPLWQAGTADQNPGIGHHLDPDHQVEQHQPAQHRCRIDPQPRQTQRSGGLCRAVGQAGIQKRCYHHHDSAPEQPPLQCRTDIQLQREQMRQNRIGVHQQPGKHQRSPQWKRPTAQQGPHRWCRCPPPDAPANTGADCHHRWHNPPHRQPAQPDQH